MKPNDYFTAAKGVYLNLQADFVDIVREGYKNTDLHEKVNRGIKDFISNIELLVQCILLHRGLADGILSDTEKTFIYNIGMVHDSLMEHIRKEINDDEYDLDNIAKLNSKDREKVINLVDEIVLKSVDNVALLLAPIMHKDKTNDIYNTSLDRLFFISEMFMKCDGQSTSELKSIAETINKLYALPLLNHVENYNK